MIKFFPRSPVYSWQTTKEEEILHFPCDMYLKDPDVVLFRAVTIHASPVAIFDWLCQLRVAPYSYDWIDNSGKQSPRKRNPALRNLKLGQNFMQIFNLIDFKIDEHITLLTATSSVERMFGKIALSYFIRKESEGYSRLIVKLCVDSPKNGLFAFLAPLLPLGDLIMMRKQLLTIRDLAETARS